MKAVVRVVEVLALIAAVVFVAALLLNEPSGPSSPTGSSDSPTETAGNDPGTVDLSVGQGLYGSRCAGCHGADGEGRVGPQLGGGAAIANFPDPADQANVIRNGRGGMPAFSRFSDDEIASLVAYTRGLPG